MAICKLTFQYAIFILPPSWFTYDISSKREKQGRTAAIIPLVSEDVDSLEWRRVFLVCDGQVFDRFFPRVFVMAKGATTPGAKKVPMDVNKWQVSEELKPYPFCVVLNCLFVFVRTCAFVQRQRGAYVNAGGRLVVLLWFLLLLVGKSS